MAGLLNLGTIDIWGHIIRHCDATLCIIGYLADSLGSTHWMTVTLLSNQVVTTKNVQILPNVP